MPLDPNIILSGQAPQFASPLDTMAKALTFKQLAQQSQQADRMQADNDSVKQAYQKNLVTNPDGTTSINKQGVLSDLYKVNPAKAMETETAFKEADQQAQARQLDTLTKQATAAKSLAWSISDEGSYQNARDTAIKMGLPNAQNMPQQYDPNLVKRMQMATLDAKDRLDQQWKQTNYDEDKRHHLATEDNVSEKRDQSASERVDKLTKNMKDDFDADRGRSGNFGQISAKVQSAERLQTLVNAYKDSGGNLPKAQMEELSMGLAGMLTNSNSPAVSQVQALVPHTFMGNVQDAGSWLLNEPRGADQQKFVSKMADTINREKNLANDQLNSIRASRLPAHGTLKNLAPDKYNALLQSYGLDESNIKNGKYVPPNKSAQDYAVPPPHPQDDAAVAWAKANPRDPRSAEILKANGVEN